MEARRDRTTDVLRGMTGIGMILVNTRSSDAPSFLNHGGFHGPITFADTIFPCFLFTSGIATPPKALPTRALVRRAGLLFSAGLAVNQIPRLLHSRDFLDFTTLRLPGVLQRTAFASLVASIDAYLPTGVLPTALLALWYYVSKQYAYSPKDPFPCAHATAQSRVDAHVFGVSHLHIPAQRFDPEGFLGSVLTSPVSIIMGRLFRGGMVAATSYLTGLRQTRATLFPVPNHKSDVSSRPPIVQKLLPTVAAAGTALAIAQLSSRVLTYAAPYPTPPSKALWTPSFVGQTTAYSIGYWAVSDVLVALTRFDEVPLSIRKGISFIVDRLETLGRMSLEGYLISCVAQSLLQVGGESSAWALAKGGLERTGLSGRLSGVVVSLALSIAIVEATRKLEKRRWTVR